MATTVNYAASLVTRKTNYSSNGSSNSAAQEFYEAGSNNVGIICFSGMNLANKVIQEIIFTITAKKAGYGEGSTKTVYLRKANYQRLRRRQHENSLSPEGKLPEQYCLRGNRFRLRR